jgi:hypothetical protein
LLRLRDLHRIACGERRGRKRRTAEQDPPAIHQAVLDPCLTLIVIAAHGILPFQTLIA